MFINLVCNCFVVSFVPFPIPANFQWQKCTTCPVECGLFVYSEQTSGDVNFTCICLLFRGGSLTQKTEKNTSNSRKSSDQSGPSLHFHKPTLRGMQKSQQVGKHSPKNRSVVITLVLSRNCSDSLTELGILVYPSVFNPQHVCSLRNSVTFDETKKHVIFY